MRTSHFNFCEVSMRESRYQRTIIQRLEEEFPGCVVLKNDPNYIQGMPDLVVLYHDRWAMLEVKASRTAAVRPNQEHYISLLAQMSYAAFVYPEIEDRIFYELQLTFGDRRQTRISKS